VQYVTSGIVLRDTNYKDSHRLLTVLTAEGEKRTVLARRARQKGSRLAAAPQLLTYSEMRAFYLSRFLVLDAASTIAQFLPLRADVALLALG
jgi:DNA repair protein RecO (recombination protein O)